MSEMFGAIVPWVQACAAVSTTLGIDMGRPGCGVRVHMCVRLLSTTTLTPVRAP